MGNPSGATTSTSYPTNFLLQKNQYALSYHRDKGIANWVSWHLGRQDLGSTARTDAWQSDSNLPSGWYRVTHSDYTGSGYDRGHMTPSGDRTDSTTNNAATFIMTNIIPQAPDNNQGPWNNLENYLRSLVNGGNELYIISGGAGVKGTLAGGKLSIPDRTWKVIMVLPESSTSDVARVSTSTRVIAVNMPNIQGIRYNAWESYRVSVDSIEALTGYNFFSNVDPAIQNVIESRVDGSTGPTPTPAPIATSTPAPSATKTPVPTSTPTSGSCTATSLFFSEYIEGSSNNKALEIFNGTGGAVDLGASGYSVRLYSNGATSPSSSVNLTGVVAANDVFVIANSAATQTILQQANITSGVASFNGNDALVLAKNGVVVDSIGQVGSYPSTEWGTSTTSTADNTLLRKSSIKAGDSNSGDTFSPSLQWDGYAMDTFGNLGRHSVTCP